MLQEFREAFFDEKASDAIVIDSLTAHIRKLEGKLSMILVDEKNNLYVVPEGAAQLVTEEMRVRLLAELEAQQMLLKQGITTAAPQVANTQPG
jgi:hypothetical protein